MHPVERQERDNRPGETARIGRPLKCPSSLLKTLPSLAVLLQTCTDTAGRSVPVDDPACANKMESVTVTQQKPKVELPIVDKLKGFATTASMYIRFADEAHCHTAFSLDFTASHRLSLRCCCSDVVQTWYLIVGVGGGGAVVLGFVWLMLMKQFAGVIVWATIVAFILMEAIGTFVCAMKVRSPLDNWPAEIEDWPSFANKALRTRLHFVLCLVVKHRPILNFCRPTVKWAPKTVRKGGLSCFKTVPLLRDEGRADLDGRHQRHR